MGEGVSVPEPASTDTPERDAGIRRFLFSIVTFNNEAMIGGILDDIRRARQSFVHERIEVTTRIFDNGSRDRTREIIWESGFGSSLTESRRYLAFGAGHNRNILGRASDVAIIANPDIRFPPGIIGAIRTKLESEPELWLLFPGIAFPDGTEQKLCKRNARLFDLCLRRFAPAALKQAFRRRIDAYEMVDSDYGTEFDVEFEFGCFMIARTPAFEAVGGFDERYFLYLEDADLTREIRQAGFRARYAPLVTITHEWERGSYQWNMLAFAHILSALKYALKWSVVRRVLCRDPGRRKKRYA